MSIFDKPIGRIIFQSADKTEYGDLTWDASAAVRVDAGTATGTVQHNGKEYNFIAAFTPPPKPVPVANVLTCTVGPGMDFPHLGDAFVAARDHDVTDLHISILPVPGNPDYYTNTEQKTTPSPITGRGFYGEFHQNTIIEAIPMLDAEGKRILPRLSISGAGTLYYRKAILIPFGDLTVRGIEFDGGPEGQWYTLTPIRPEGTSRPQKILVEDCHMHHWANGGGLGTFGEWEDGNGIKHKTPGCSWIGRRNYIHDAGTGNGTEHGIYVAGIDEMISEDELYVRVAEGHLFKTRAKKVTIKRGRFFELDSTASFGVDVPEGAEFLFEDSIIQRGPNSHNGPAIAVAEEIQTALFPQGIVKDDGRTRSITLHNITILSTTPPEARFLGTLGMWNRMNAMVTNIGMKVFGPPRASMMNNGTSDVLMPGDVTMLTVMPDLDMRPPMFGGK